MGRARRTQAGARYATLLASDLPGTDGESTLNGVLAWEVDARADVALRPRAFAPRGARCYAARPSMLKVFENNDADYVSRFEALCHRQASVSDEIDAAARQVIAEVRSGGDAAVRALTAKFEKRELGALELSAS